MGYPPITQPTKMTNVNVTKTLIVYACLATAAMAGHNLPSAAEVLRKHHEKGGSKGSRVPNALLDQINALPSRSDPEETLRRRLPLSDGFGLFKSVKSPDPEEISTKGPPNGTLLIAKVENIILEAIQAQTKIILAAIKEELPKSRTKKIKKNYQPSDSGGPNTGDYSRWR